MHRHTGAISRRYDQRFFDNGGWGRLLKAKRLGIFCQPPIHRLGRFHTHCPSQNGPQSLDAFGERLLHAEPLLPVFQDIRTLAMWKTQPRVRGNVLDLLLGPGSVHPTPDRKRPKHRAIHLLVQLVTATERTFTARHLFTLISYASARCEPLQQHQPYRLQFGEYSPLGLIDADSGL